MSNRKPVPAGTPAPAATAPAAPTSTTPQNDGTPEGNAPSTDAGAPAGSAPENSEQSSAPATQAPGDHETVTGDQVELVEARVLLAFGDHEVNDVVALADDAVERLFLSGHVDPHPDAVAFAKGDA